MRTIAYLFGLTMFGVTLAAQPRDTGRISLLPLALVQMMITFTNILPLHKLFR